MIDGLLLTAMAIGHVCLAVLVVNVLHGLGLPEAWMRPIKVAAIATLAGSSIGLALLAFVEHWTDWPRPILGYGLLCGFIAIGVLPALTIRKQLHGTPPGITGDCKTVDLAVENPRSELIGSASDSFWLRLPGNDAFKLRLSEWDVGRPGLHAGLDGLTILQLTDLHLSRAYSERFFEAMLGAVEDPTADLVVFTGDLSDDPTMLDLVEPLLGRFRGRLGTLAILGNHDYRHELGPARDALGNAGFQTIEGEWTVVDADGVRLAIGGTSAPWGPRMDYGAIPDADYRLLLSHCPDQFPHAARHGVDLVLSGHTHGGQYRLPILGPILMPSRYSRRYDRGFFRRGRSLMYVALGIAGQHAMRINCPAEIPRLTLRSMPELGAPAALTDRSVAAVG